MTEEKKSVDQLMTMFVKIIPLLPIGGLILALCYEFAYFTTLGLSMSDILRLNDLVEASALKVLPLLPAAIFSTWMGHVGQSQRALDIEVKSMVVRNIAAVLVAVIFFALSIFYIAFGYHWQYGPSIIAFTSVVFPTLLLMVPIIIRIFSPDAVRLILFGFLFLSLYGTWGFFHAQKIRYGDRTKLISTKIDKNLNVDLKGEFLLVRRFSSGALITIKNGNTIWFVPDNLNYVLTHEFSDTPFKGVICNVFEWCPERFRYKRPSSIKVN